MSKRWTVGDILSSAIIHDDFLFYVEMLFCLEAQGFIDSKRIILYKKEEEI